MILSGTLRPYRSKILVAVAFVLIEKLAWIVEPTLFGHVIDAMIESLADPPLASPVLPLLAWIGVFGVNSGVGTYRRIRDERIFLAIHTEIATGIAARVERGTLDPARGASRALLSHEVVNFYQYRAPDFIEQAIDVVGAIVALTLFDWRLGGTCATILLPLFFINRFYNERVARYQKEVHDQQEEVYRVYASRDTAAVRAFYAGMSTWKQRIANVGALNFGILRAFLLGIFLIILYVAIDLDNFTTGSIYSIAAYVWTFITSSEYLPEQLESWTSMREITGRLESETTEGDTPCAS